VARAAQDQKEKPASPVQRAKRAIPVRRALRVRLAYRVRKGTRALPDRLCAGSGDGVAAGHPHKLRDRGLHRGL
jgi:hypothetical protein